MEPARAGAVRENSVAEGSGKSSYSRHRHRGRDWRGRGCWTNVVLRAVVLIEVGVIEEIEAFGKELQHVLVFDMKLARHAHIKRVIGRTRMIVARHVRQQARPTLAQQIKSERIPLHAIRGKRNAGHDESSFTKRPAGLRGKDVADPPIANEFMAERIAVLPKRQIPNIARDEPVPLVGGRSGSIGLDVELPSLARTTTGENRRVRRGAKC